MFGFIKKIREKTYLKECKARDDLRDKFDACTTIDEVNELCANTSVYSLGNKGFDMIPQAYIAHLNENAYARISPGIYNAVAILQNLGCTLELVSIRGDTAFLWSPRGEGIFYDGLSEHPRLRKIERWQTTSDYYGHISVWKIQALNDEELLHLNMLPKAKHVPAFFTL